MADKISGQVRCDPPPRCGRGGRSPNCSRLKPLVYNELRKFAAARMAEETPGEGVTRACEIRENLIFRVLQSLPGVVTLL
jgi:hypothetical protein